VTSWPREWVLRYRLDGEADYTVEKYATKSQARDRYYTVREFKMIVFLELRRPDGRLWFRDNWFGEDHHGESWDDDEPPADA
jgi:hypothetical protein